MLSQQPGPDAEAEQGREHDDVEQREHAGRRRARRPRRARSAGESESSGSGGTRLDHTSSPSGFGDRALRVATLPRPHEAAAPIVSASAPSGTADARPAAMIPIPASASAPPASCAGRGRSPSSSTASPTVNAAWSCRTSDASPAGMPRSIPMNSSENWPAERKTPTAITYRTGTPGRGTNGSASATRQNRSAANSRGGKWSRPTWMTTKLTPQMTATAVAMAT